MLRSVSEVTHAATKHRLSFSNLVFEFAVLSLAAEGEALDWRWISDRRSPTLSLPETLRFAPRSWRDWLRDGNDRLSRLTRRATRLRATSKEDQLPAVGSREFKVLREIYGFYSSRGKHRFEGLAMEVTGRVIRESGARFFEGWVSPVGSDGGIDFVGRLDLGSGFAGTSLVVLGQAKCEDPESPTGGVHVARLVARLRRGWLGAYVTTSFFSGKVQREIFEDRFPLLTIHGKRLAEEVFTMTLERGFDSISAFLHEVDSRFDSVIADRPPEEIVL